MQLNRFLRAAAVVAFVVVGFASSSVRADAVTMKAGAAKAVITPDNYKELVTVMGTHATDKDHDIFARALVLNDGTSRLVGCVTIATSG